MSRLLRAVRGARRAAVVALFVLAGGCAVDARRPGILELDVRASRGGTARLYLYTGGVEREPDGVVESPLVDTRDAQTLRFAVVPPVRMMRFDPFDGAGAVSVLGMRFLPQQGAPIRLPMRIGRICEVATLHARADGFDAVTNANATDPWLELDTGALRPSRWGGLDRVTPTSVALVAGALALLVAAASWAAVRGRTAAAGRRDRVALGCALLGMGALIVGAKLWIIATYGSSVPFLDEWADHAMFTFLPFSWGELRWGDLFRAANEHRLVLPRILALVLLIADGQWNAIDGTVVDAVLHGLAAVILLAVLWRRAAGRSLDGIAAAVLLAFALPFSWENTLWAYQSCVYLLLLTLVLPLALVPESPPGSWPWWCGVLLLGLAPLSMGSGVANAGCVLIAVVLDQWRRPRSAATFAANVVACSAIVAIGVALLVPTPPHHVALRARSIAEFAMALGSALAWPAVDEPLVALVAWSPMIAMAVTCAWRRRRPDRLFAVLLALGAWVVVQAAAVAYSRGGSSSLPGSRHQDFLSLGFVVNATAALALLRRGGCGPSRAAVAPVVAWACWTASGLVRLTNTELVTQLGPRGEHGRAWETNVRRFLHDDDRAAFSTLPYPDGLPVGIPALLSELLLRDPFLRRRLPPRVRPALALEPGRRGPFRPDGTYPLVPRDPLAPSWGSYGPAGTGTIGRFESAPIRCALGAYLRFEVAGYLGQPGMRLRLEHEDGGHTRIAPRHLARERWVRVFVRCPRGRFRVVAEDRRSDTWFAVRPPVEYGPLSVVAETLVGAPWVPAALGILLIWLAVRRQCGAGGGGPPRP